MKNWTYMLALFAAFTAGLSSVSWSVENPGIRNPAIRNPAGVSTVPPSSLESGLVTSPSPFDRSGNDAITGNLRGSKSFRGGIPYQSGTSFWGSGLTSTEALNLRQVGGPLSPGNTLLGPTPDTVSLDSFMRDSAGWEDFGTYSGKYTTPQYYSRTNTMSTTTPERPGVFKPMDTRVTGTIPDVYGSEVLRNRTLPEQDNSASDIVMRSTPLTTEEIRRLTSGEARVSSRSEPFDAEQYRKQIEQVRLDLVKMRSKTTSAGLLPGSQPIGGQPAAPADAQRDDLLRLLPQPGVTLTGREKETGEIRKLAVPYEEPERLEDQTGKPTGLVQTELDDVKLLSGYETLDKSPLDALLWPNKQESGAIPKTGGKGTGASMTDLDKLAEQIANLKRKGTSISTAEPLQVGVSRTDTGESDASGKYSATALGGSGITGGESIGVGALPDTTLKSYRDLVLKNAEGPTDEVTLSEVNKVKSLSAEDVSVKAKQILGEHKSHESLSQARYKKYIAEGQAYLKQGRYYQAVNAYEQASIFDSTQPDAPAGRCLALFCAGEYMSSALFLARAIEMSDEYARSKVDLASAMGGNDKLETRITDAEEWLERSCAPELEFLLAYMYYHSGRLEPATRAIATAAKEMPNSKAVKALKEVIDATPKPAKQK